MKQKSGSTRREELTALFKIGANVGNQLKVPQPPIEFGYLIKYHSDISLSCDVTPQSIHYYASLNEIELNHIEVDVIITLETVRVLAIRGLSPDKIMEIV